MLQPDFAVVEMLMREEVRERLHEVEIYRLLRQTKATRSRWLLQQSCWLLSQFGHLLVALGLRLQQYGSAQPVSPEPAEVLGRE
jgi:hypothetical protein